MRFICHFERSEAESRNLPKLLIIQISPLRAAFNSPPVEMTKAQNLIIIGIRGTLRTYYMSDRSFGGFFNYIAQKTYQQQLMRDYNLVSKSRSE